MARLSAPAARSWSNPCTERNSDGRDASSPDRRLAEARSGAGPGAARARRCRPDRPDGGGCAACRTGHLAEARPRQPARQ
ncbi:MAG: hypothetical protein B7X67_30150, partial [Rhizobiales bacterium 39-66-18]